VKRQIRATINGGVQLRRGVRVFAGSIERLEAKCREVIADPPRDHDRAIVVLLTKLADVGNAIDSPTEQAAAAEKREELQYSVRQARALAWLELNPDVAREIDQLVATELPPGTIPPVRAIYRNAAIVKAWTDAGEPVLETTAKTSDAGGSP
jgi:hypothetical protein